MKNAETQKLAADNSLKDALKLEKFRWQSLINDPVTGKRSQLMQLNKPKGDAAAALPAFENPRNLQLGKEPVTIKAGILISVGDNPEEIGVSENTQQINSMDEQAVQAPLSILSCLQKFHQEAKQNSGEGTPPVTPDEYSVLNAQIANMKVKKLLQIADNIRNDDSVAITATRATID